MSLPISLCMIVKNEAHVIERCLASVKPWIHNWIIVDTGSDDETPALISEALKDLPGKLYQRPWVDFGSNRTQALELARTLHLQGCSNQGYILMIDADDQLIVDEGFSWGQLTADGYNLLHEMPPTVFRRVQLFSAAKPWQYKGKVHEYPVLPNSTIRNLDGLKIKIGLDGHRRQQDSKEKYLQDAALLEQAVAEDPNDMRSLFYLAQSYRDAQDYAKAFEIYSQRAKGRGWNEETWYAQYQAGLIAAQHLERLEQGTEILLDAFQKNPRRMEAAVYLSQFYRRQRNIPMAHLFAQYAASATKPSKSFLFMQPACYGSWRALDELSLATFHLGENEKAIQLFEQLLKHPELPEAHKLRVQANLAFATGEPNDAPLPLRASRPRPEIATLVGSFIEQTGQAPLSLNACTFLARFAEQEVFDSALDLGTGLATSILRQAVLGEVDSVIVSEEHKKAVDRFLQQVDPGNKEVQLWHAYSQAPEKNYELVVFGLSSVFIPHAWNLVRPGGFLYINGMGRFPFHHQINGFVHSCPHTKHNIKPYTKAGNGYGWLISKPKLSRGGHPDQTVVIGVGTGRCGTLSLATLLDKQYDSCVTHESGGPLAWDAKPEIISQQLQKLKDRPYELVGDVASYYLPHIEQLLEDPSVIIVGLQRNKKATVRSFDQWTGNKNHWMTHDGKTWVHDPWDVAFPKFVATSKQHAIGQYWDAYYDTLEMWQTKYPDRVKLFEVSQLDSASDIQNLMGFLKKTNGRVIVGIHKNQRRRSA